MLGDCLELCTKHQLIFYDDRTKQKLAHVKVNVCLRNSSWKRNPKGLSVASGWDFLFKASPHWLHFV